jgi:hypothetical protein
MARASRSHGRDLIRADAGTGLGKVGLRHRKCVSPQRFVLDALAQLLHGLHQRVERARDRIAQFREARISELTGEAADGWRRDAALVGCILDAPGGKAQGIAQNELRELPLRGGAPVHGGGKLLTYLRTSKGNRRNSHGVGRRMNRFFHILIL